MAEIHKIEKNGVTIYPATTTDAVVDKETRRTIKEEFSLIKNKSVSFDIGKYIDKTGKLINYSRSKISEFLNIPTKDFTITGVWDGSNSGFGFVFYDEKFNFISGFNDESTSYASYKWKVDSVQIPDNAKYLVIQSQSNGIIIDSEEQLSSGMPFLSTINTNIKLSKNEEQIDSLNPKVSALSGREFSIIEKQVTLGLEGKYINLSGDPASYNAFNISNYIQINKGDCVIAYIRANKSTAAIAKCDKNLTSFTPVVIGDPDNDSYYIWLADEDCNVAFSYEKDKMAKCYIYSSYLWHKLTSVAEETDKNSKKLERAAEYQVVIGKNLFNSEEIIDGYYISSSSGGLASNQMASVSPFIPVKAGEIYYLHRESSIGTGEARFLKEDMETVLKPLNAEGEEFPYGYNISQSTSVKAPNEAAYFQFTCKFNGKECGYNQTQFEKGNQFTGYEPYEKRRIINYSNLPEDLEGLAERVVQLEDSVMNTSESINIRNSDKIGFFSNSFLNGYCMLGKHAINNLSMFSDYIMYNYGHSGDDLLELLGRINSNETWLGDVPVQEWGIKYGVIAMQDNDGALFAASSDTYYENGKKLANAIKAMGGIPILSTEHDQVRYYYNFVRLSNEEGYLFMNWGKNASALFNSVFAPFWRNSHPATRTAWMWTYGIKQYLDTLPRPYKSIKLFRARNTIDASNIQNLMYDDFYSRAERFEELTCGVSALTESTEKYFDRLDTGNASYQTYKDEYQMLQAKTSPVSFGNFALIEIVTPYDNNNITSLSFQLDGTGVTNAYIKRINSLDNPLPSTRYIAFGVTAGEALLIPGTKFQITGGVFNNNLLGTYIVEDVINGIVVTATSSSGKTTSGTDTPTIDIEGVQLLGSYDYPSADYMNRYNKPLGEWEEISLQDNKVILDSYLHGCMDFDKISILLRGTNIILNDLNCTVSGQSKKQSFRHPILLEKKGESIINTTTFNDEDTDWEGIENLEKYIPVVSTVNPEKKENLPKGITTVRIINPGQSIKQPLNTGKITSSNFLSAQLEIKLIARYFPEYIDDDSKWNTSPIKRGSFDCATLDVMIAANSSDENPVIVGRIVIGAWWNQFIIDTPYFEGTHLILKCGNKQIQIAKCDCILLK